MNKRLISGIIGVAAAVSLMTGCGKPAAAVEDTKAAVESEAEDESTAVKADEETGTETAAETAAQAKDMKQGVTTVANEESITGFTTMFLYQDDKATNVQLVGGFQFYVENDPKVYAEGFTLAAGDKMENYLYSPDQWQKDLKLRHINDAGLTMDMEYDEASKAWTASLELPCASYLYTYNVSYDSGKTYEMIVDPNNVPSCNAMGAHQTRSQFFVPYDASKQSEEDDWTWLFPVEDEKDRGRISHVTYQGADSSDHQAEIYLPAGYDEDRQQPYKVLYLTHGGGGEEGDWFYQGNAGNIVDRLAAEGKTEGFVIVCMNNAEFLIEGSRDWDYDAIFDNTVNYLMPYIESGYNVSTEAQDMAYAGLSSGAKTTGEIYYKAPEMFGYFGMFSGSAAWDWPELEDYSSMKKPNIYLAAGFADHLMMQDTYHTDGDKTLIGFKELLDKAGITYNGGGEYVTVQGAHDWYTWPQILKDYVETTLWK